MQDKILVVDDEEGIRFALTEALNKRGYYVDTAADAESALSKFRQASFDLVIMDVKLPKMSGIEAISAIRDIDPHVVIIVITAYGSKELAMDAIRNGAYDYFTKPFKLDEMEIVIKRALEKSRLQIELRSLQEKLQKRHQFANIIGNSASMREVFELIQKVAPTDSTVLICGESGTGKELIAEAIHTLSKRKDKPHIKLNCVAIPETLLESELFGYEKGAFTGAIVQKQGKFELADGGTIFLDEIGDMSPNTQAKVLRALQEKEFERVGGKKPIKVDVRIIAATNKNLLEAIKKGQFREDLYFRLNVISIQLPSLREKKEDIPRLAEHFLLQANDNFGKKISGFSKEVISFFMDYYWPGNVRELKNCIERAVVTVEGEVITLECIPPYMQELIKTQKFKILNDSSLDAAVKTVERQIILDALRKTDEVQSKAAKILGITERSLWYRIKKLGIDIKS